MIRYCTYIKSTGRILQGGICAPGQAPAPTADMGVLLTGSETATALTHCVVDGALQPLGQDQLAALKWSEVRAERDRRMDAFSWRLERHARQARLGTEPTDDIAALDAHMQALADITGQADPFSIEWPTPPA